MQFVDDRSIEPRDRILERAFAVRGRPAPAADAAAPGIAGRAAALVAALAMLLATADRGLGNDDATDRAGTPRAPEAGVADTESLTATDGVADTAAAEDTTVPTLVGPEFSVELGPVTEADRQIYRAVRSQLFWSPFVNANEVTVEVTEGVVTLTGTVHSARERDAAEANAHDAGALSVRNYLAVNDLAAERTPR